MCMASPRRTPYSPRRPERGMPVVQTILLLKSQRSLSCLRWSGLAQGLTVVAQVQQTIHIGWPTLKWRRICSRGESQAIKISTGFSNITNSLAHAGYYELTDSMNVEFCWYKLLGGVYFEIWKRVDKL
ncbi:hypothetical protein PVAP13_3NG140711 [Panicum virgatum]|uniref:Uncharacterized protein n=1 Tax=Panicum virgatum TaxID=38727 RepID=A0A8T0U805_PANVG|nr:hypothetical protein PVAP13_3NG140711 [Panicum virgatum]